MEDVVNSAQDQIQILEQKLRLKEVQMNSIQEIGKRLSSELNLDRLLIIIMDEVTRLMNAERSTFYIVDSERGELWSKIAQKAEITEIRLPVGKGIAGNVAKTGATINIPDAYKDSRFSPETDKKTGYRTRSILCMPIFEPQRNQKQTPNIIGVLQILNKKDGAFTSADEDMLNSLASQVAIAIINSRLYSEIEKKAAEIQLLFDIEKEITQAYDAHELLGLLINKITDTIDVQAGLIALTEDSRIKEVVSRNIAINQNDDSAEILQDEMVSDVLRSGEIQNLHQQHGVRDNISIFQSKFGIEINDILALPLRSEGQIIGFLILINKNKKDDFFRREDELLVESISRQISRTIEQFQLRDQKVKADRLAAIGNLMSNIVHDIRTPINNINGFVDLLKDESDPELKDEFSGIIRNQISLLTNMTKDILDFSKGKSTILPVKVPVDQLIKNFSKTFENEILKKGYKFISQCNVATMIYVDHDKIFRVFMNIMKNSLEAMSPGGVFSIIANDNGDMVEFLLSDSGKGIPVEIRGKLFESFVTSGKKEGTGLGLAIVKKVIDDHGGRIEVESETGVGTTFKIYINKYTN